MHDDAPQVALCARVLPNLHARFEGGKGHPCVMLHGFASTSHIWDAVVDSFPADWTCCLVDLRGHGNSSWDPGLRYRVEDHVGDVVHTLGKLQLGPCTLVGHSLGGLIALAVAADHPDLVAGLVLVDVAPKVDREVFLRARAHLPESFRAFRDPVQYQSVLERRYPLAPSSLLAVMAERELEPGPGDWLRVRLDPALADLNSIDHEPGFWAHLDKVSCPTLVIRGAASSFLSKDAATAMAKRLANGRLITVQNAGHTVMLDNLAGFCGAIRPFVADMAGKAPPCLPRRPDQPIQVDSRPAAHGPEHVPYHGCSPGSRD